MYSALPLLQQPKNQPISHQDSFVWFYWYCCSVLAHLNPPHPNYHTDKQVNDERSLHYPLR